MPESKINYDLFLPALTVADPELLAQIMFGSYRLALAGSRPEELEACFVRLVTDEEFAFDVLCGIKELADTNTPGEVRVDNNVTFRISDDPAGKKNLQSLVEDNTALIGQLAPAS